VREVWVSGHPVPTDGVDVTEYLDQKIDALLCHVSQHANPAVMRERVTEWMGRTAQAFGLPEGRLAEAFRVVHVS
jgi:hypothetical protein